MAAPAYTYSLTNGTTADASQVMQDFNDILNGVTDGTKDLTMSALTANGAANLKAAVTLGASSSNDLTVNGALASTIAIKTNNAFAIGSATKGLTGIFLGNVGAGATCQVLAASHATTRNYTIPDCGAAANFVMSQSSQTLAGAITFSAMPTISLNASSPQLTIARTGSSTGSFTIDAGSNVLSFAGSSSGVAAIKMTDAGQVVLGRTGQASYLGTQSAGKTDGAAVTSGYIGEVVSGAAAANTTTDLVNRAAATASVSLTAGLWLIVATGAGYWNTASGNSSTAGCVCAIRNTTDSSDVALTDYIAQRSFPAAIGDNILFSWSIQGTVNITGTKSYRIELATETVSGTPTGAGIGTRAGGAGITAIRIG